MSSKYDSVKVKVCLGDGHFYILSRFLLSKMLAFCKVPSNVATRISLDVKRCFVNEGMLSITSKQLEQSLCDAMVACGYGPEYHGLLPVITTFYTERVPLILFIAGSGKCGKTTIAQHLGTKLNCNTVVNTELLMDVTDAISDVAVVSSHENEKVSEGYTDTASRQELLSPLEWRRQCQRLRPAVDSEVKKALKEGKVIIIEGEWLDIGLYKQYLNPEYQQLHRCIVMAFFIEASARCRQLAMEWSDVSSIDADNNTNALDTLLCHYDEIEKAQLQSIHEAFPPQCSSPHEGISDESSYKAPYQKVFVTDPSEIPQRADVIHSVVVDRIIEKLLT